MKQCNNCDTEKDYSEFNRNKLKKDGLQTYCRPCAQKFNNDNYRNSPVRRAKLRARDKKETEKSYQMIFRHKRLVGCRKCGEREPVALDYHHIEPKLKDMPVSRMVCFSHKRLKAEIRKCVVICSNCHRKLYAGLITL
jgi:hypothetical protein